MARPARRSAEQHSRLSSASRASRRGAALLGALALLMLGCKTVGPSTPLGTGTAMSTPVSVQSLEVSFDGDGRGLIELGLQVSGGGGVATQAQWQLLLDGRPLGSGVQLLSQRLAEGRSTLKLAAPLPLPHATRDEGWRTVTLEVSGELTVTSLFAQRWPFAFRRQALVRGAPRP